MRDWIFDLITAGVLLTLMVYSASVSVSDVGYHLRAVALVTALFCSSAFGVLLSALGYRRNATAWKREGSQT